MKNIIEQIKEKEKSELERLIEYAGSQALLAALLGVSDQVVCNWVKRGRISATSAIDAESFTGGKFKAADLRPNVKEWRVK